MMAQWKFFLVIATLHRGAFCQFPFRWIYYNGSKETCKTDLSALTDFRKYVSLKKWQKW